MIALDTRRVLPLAAALALCACGGDDTSASPGGAGGATSSGAGGASSSGIGGTSSSGSGGAPSSSGSGGSVGVGGAGGSAPPPCDSANPSPPPGDVLWPPQLSATGADTLGGHGHDDGKGPIGFCASAPEPGEAYYAIIAVGFETDEDINGDGDQNDALPVDFYADPGSFTGLGESGGRINIYAQVLDEDGNVLSGSSAPDLRYLLSTEGAPDASLPLDNKPPNEFQTNFPMTGGNTYGLQVDAPSDRVFNMRLPNNHHITFAIVLQRRAP